MGCGASTKDRPAQDDVQRIAKGSAGSADDGVVPVGPTSSSKSDGKDRSTSKDKKPALQEPDKEPSVEGTGEPSGGSSRGGWGRSDKKVQRIRRKDTVKQKSSADVAPGEAPVSEISPENRRFIAKILQKHFLFSALEDDERMTAIDYMKLKRLGAGEVVFEQGDEGDSCYIIQSGTYAVSINGGNVKQLRAKQTFGELAMLYNQGRTAAVTCSQEGSLWQMNGSSFRQCMELINKKHLNRVLAFFEQDPNFSKMKDEERRLLAGACSVQVFGRGEQILREGEVGDWMFIVIDGNVQTVDRYGNSAVKKPGTILGIAGLMYTKQQISGAKAIDHVTCLALGKSSLERLVGPVEDILRRSAIRALTVDNVGKSQELEFFRHLTYDQQNLMIDRFEDMSFEEGDVVITSGSRAQMIIIIEGEVALVADDAEGGFSPSVGAGRSRESAREVLMAGHAYGGKALLEGSAMPEFGVALSRVRLHRVGYDMVVHALKEPLRDVIRLNEIKKVLLDIFLFKSLSDEQIDRTIRALEKRKYAAGDPIMQQGEDAQHFFLIQSGTIQVTKDGEKLRTLGRWDYLGERGLLLQEKRSASCHAEDACVCLVLDVASFDQIVGQFKKDLEHRILLQDLNIQMEDLRLKAVVGRGSFGIVKLCTHRDDMKKEYALKCVGKTKVVKQGQQKSICIERDINAACYHPCIMQFIKTFQDSKNIYFLTEFLGGGDLFYAIREIGNLNKTQCQWFSGSILLALEYLHARTIMYRDLKPENVLLDLGGNAKLVDFGCCKRALRTNTLVGTPEYFAPEVILGKGYTCAIDWWALGVMMHEFIVGPLPFGRNVDDQLELFREILEAPLQFPNYVKDEAALSIITGMLERDPALRLGASTRGAKEIKDHRYFAALDWDGLVGRYLPPPFVPNASKLKKNWELCKGELLVEEPAGEEDAMAASQSQKKMEWAVGF